MTPPTAIPAKPQLRKAWVKKKSFNQTCACALCALELDMPGNSDYGDPERRPEMLNEELSLQTQVNSRLEEENVRLRGLVDLGCLLNVSESRAHSLQLIAEKVRHLLDTDVVCVALVRESSGTLDVEGWSDARGKDLRSVCLPMASGLGARILETTQGVLLEECSMQDTEDGTIERVVAETGPVTVMGAPIRMGLECVGVIYAFGPVASRFSKSQLDWLALVGDLAGTEIGRRRIEDELKESEERFRFMAETTGDVLYRLSYEPLGYDYISPGVRRLTGYGQEEIQSIGFSGLVLRIDTPGQENVSQEMIRSRRLEGKTGEYRADYLIKTKEGGLKWLRDHSFPWLDEHSKVIGSVGILSDVTDYRRAEARIQECTNDLIESEEKYRSLVENVPLVVYRMGAQGEILFANQFFQEVFGYSPVEVLRNPKLWAERVYEDDRKRIEDLRNRCQREGGEFFAEYRVLHRDGQPVYILDHAVPFQGPDGLITSLDGIMFDMTGRLRLQEHLLQAQGIKTISEVSARLAHEIRNPLVSAGGFARLLLAAMSHNDPNRAKAEIIVKEVARLEMILRMILSTIQPLDLQIGTGYLNSMLQSILRSLESDLRSKDVQVEFNLDSANPALALDPLQMERALEAIFKNALNQAREHGTLSISSLQHLKNFMLTIKYPVAHLSNDDIEHFFYPFTSFAACSETTDLPLSKIIINKHGGQTEVKLNENREVTIEIVLPL
jgi:PAS domain S-box-containing protein